MNEPERQIQTDFTNLVDVLRSSVEKFGPRPILGTERNGDFEWVTFTEFGALIDQFRGGLASLGVGAGDAVAVISNNRLEGAVGSHACYSLGAKYVAMYEAQKDAEWQFILKDSGAVTCLVANGDIEARVHALRGELPQLRHVVNFEGPSSEATSYAALMSHGSAHPVSGRIPDPNDVATLIYTSGTTGDPKGVVLTHANLAANVNSLVQIVDVNQDDRSICFLPWAHVFGGCVELNLGLVTGASAAICSDPTKLVEYIPKVKPTILFAVPRVWNGIHAGVTNRIAKGPKPIRWMFDNALTGKRKQRAGEPVSLSEKVAVALGEKILFPKIREGLGGRLRFAISGAAALSRDVGEFMVSLGVDVYEGYGLSETGGGATAQPMDAPRLGSVGKPLPNVRIELDHTVTGATDVEGEVIIYGANVMGGYHNRPAETEKALTPDGGLRTGDLGRFDADGYLYITGRVKELYKLENGRYVAPVPLETQLETSPYVAQAIVTGQNKPHNVALIVPDLEALLNWAQQHGIAGDAETLLTNVRVLELLEGEVEQANQQFKGFEKVVDFVIDTEALTPQNGLLTQTLKPKRRSIMEKYGNDFDSLYPQAGSERPAPRASFIRELRGRAKAG